MGYKRQELKHGTRLTGFPHRFRGSHLPPKAMYYRRLSASVSISTTGPQNYPEFCWTGVEPVVTQLARSIAVHRRPFNSVFLRMMCLLRVEVLVWRVGSTVDLTVSFLGVLDSLFIRHPVNEHSSGSLRMTLFNQSLNRPFGYLTFGFNTLFRTWHDLLLAVVLVFH